MKRNIKRIIDARQGNIPSAYNISLEDMETIKYLATENGKESPVMALTLAFTYGYEMGVRAERHKHANKRRD